MKKTELEKNLKNLKKVSPERPRQIQVRNQELRTEIRAKKDARFTARLSAADFEGLKRKAEREGMGYQTLLGSIIHKYLSGQLVDLEEVRKILKTA